MIAAGADLGADRGSMSHSAQGVGASASARGSGTKCQCLRVSARHDEMGQTITGRVVAAWGTATSIDIYVKVGLSHFQRCASNRGSVGGDGVPSPNSGSQKCHTWPGPTHTLPAAFAVRLQCTLTLCTPRG
jgi:hypothetical protein